MSQPRLALTEGTGLAALTALVPPPEHPAVGARSWDWLFERLDTRLPADFVALMDVYGAGTWLEWLSFARPRDHGERGLVAEAGWRMRTYRGHREAHPDSYPLPVWPEPGGILPFASTIDADWLAWLTIGEPDEWPVIHLSRHFPQHRSVMACGLTALMLDWVRGGPLFDLDWEDGPLVFEPH